MNEKKAENVLFVVDGGIGKNIMSTVPIRGIKAKYPDKRLIIVCGYPDVFQNNPNVYRAYSFNNTSYMYDDYIGRGKAIVLKTEPYHHNDYINDNRHLTDVWCEQLGVPFDNPVPDIHLTSRERKDAEQFIKQKKKPVFLIQNQGGMPPQPNKPQPKMFIRDLPHDITQEVVDKMKKKYHVLHLRAATQRPLDGTEQVSYPMRLSMSLLEHGAKFLLIDSMFQHVAAAMGKKAVVCWAGTSPERLGYKQHTNLRMKECPDPECHRPNSFLFDRDGTQQPWSCPHDEACRNHSVKEILSALK